MSVVESADRPINITERYQELEVVSRELLELVGKDHDEYDFLCGLVIDGLRQKFIGKRGNDYGCRLPLDPIITDLEDAIVVIANRIYPNFETYDELRAENGKTRVRDLVSSEAWR